MCYSIKFIIFGTDDFTMPVLVSKSVGVSSHTPHYKNTALIIYILLCLFYDLKPLEKLGNEITQMPDFIENSYSTPLVS